MPSVALLLVPSRELAELYLGAGKGSRYPFCRQTGSKYITATVRKSGCYCTSRFKATPPTACSLPSGCSDIFIESWTGSGGLFQRSPFLRAGTPRECPIAKEYAYRTTRLTYQYHTVSILDFADADLEKQDNPFALVVLAAKTALMAGKIPERQLLERKSGACPPPVSEGLCRQKGQGNTSVPGKFRTV